jgi:uncharacterized protein YlxW (UPF0749 family)
MNKRITIILVSMIVGLLVIMQFRSYAGVESLLSREVSERDIVSTIYTLKMANESLKDDISSLETELQKYSDQSKNSENIAAEIEKNEILLGYKPISGPGLQIEISKNMTVEDFVDFVNEWWALGAESIVIENQRLLEQQNSFYYLNEEIIIDGEILNPPHTFKIIGDPDVLEHFLLTSPILEDATYQKLSEITA